MKRVIASVAAVMLTVGVALVAVAPVAHADDSNAGFSSYGADATATGIHVLSYTNGLTNFATGFLDNSYPLASSHMDAGPATQAVASVGDSGPLGATAQGVAQDLCAPTGQISPDIPAQCYAVLAASPVPIAVEQPQYAVARYPGGAPAASQSQGGTVAESVADENFIASSYLGEVDEGAFEATLAEVDVDTVRPRIDPERVPLVAELPAELREALADLAAERDVAPERLIADLVKEARRR